ncbi:hypothetical protein BT69DRAFT_481697 [Atractiella rhizophila]|nr:hypothetical protein BT69DRAFT_481697 [Atractiella rhizophila]
MPPHILLCGGKRAGPLQTEESFIDSSNSSNPSRHHTFCDHDCHHETVVGADKMAHRQEETHAVPNSSHNSKVRVQDPLSSATGTMSQWSDGVSMERDTQPAKLIDRLICYQYSSSSWHEAAPARLELKG